MADPLGMIETPLAPVEGPEPARAPLGQRLWDQTVGAFRNENLVVASANATTAPDAGRFDENFRLFDHLTPEEQLDFEWYSGANSVRDVEFFRERRRQETALRDKMRDGPLPEWLIGTIASTLDITTLIPVLGPISKQVGGVRSALALGGSAVASAVVQEAALQNTTWGRTAEEGAASIILSALIGGGMGAFLGRGTARGLTTTGAPEGLTQDVTAMFRGAGLGDQPSVRSRLLGSTGLDSVFRADDLARAPLSFDVRPAPRSLRDFPDDTLLEIAMREQPGPFRTVRDAEAHVVELRARIEAVERNALEAALDPVMQAAAVRPGNVLPDLRAKLATAEADLSTAIGEVWNKSFALVPRFNKISEGIASPKAQAEIADAVLKAREEWEAGVAAGRVQVDELFGDVLRFNKAPVLPDPLAFLEGVAARQLTGPKVEPKKPADKGRDIPDKIEGQSGSAAATGRTTGPEQAGAIEWYTQLANSGGALSVMYALRKVGLAPVGIELGMSPFAATRKLAQKISNHGMITKGELKGYKTEDDLRRAIDQTFNPYYQHTKEVTSAFKEHQKAGGRMTREQFMEEVGKAMSVGDKHLAQVPDKFIEKAAASYRRMVNDITAKAKEVKALDETFDLKGTAESYFPRVPVHNKILTQRAAFRDLIARWYEINDTKGKAAARSEYRDAAEEVISKYLASPAGRLPAELNVPGPRGSLRERTHLIPDTFEHNGVRFGDFMDKNALRVMARYMKTVAADTEFFRMFPDGQKGFEEAMQGLRDEWKAVADAASSPAAKLRISKQGEKEENLLRWLLDRTRGTKTSPVDPVLRVLLTTLKNIRSGMFMMRLGSTITTQLADLGKMSLEEGTARVFGPAVADLVTGLKGMRMSMKEAQRAATAHDLDTAATARALADLDDQFASQGKFTRGMDAAAHAFAVASLMSPWQTWTKSHVARLAMDRMLRTAVKVSKGESLSRRETFKWAEAGLGEYEAKLIAAEAKNFEKYQGLFLANSEAWKNPEAVQAFQRGLYRAVDNGVIHPSAIDKPAIVQEFPTVFQFRSFGFASIGRLMVRSLQMHDMQTMSAMMAAMGAAGVGLALRDLATEGQVKNRSTEQWIKEMVDRSGIMWAFFETDALLDKATAGAASPVNWVTGAPTQRTAASSLASRALGPSIGGAIDLGGALQGAFTGDFTRKDLHKVVGFSPLAPLQSLIWTRWAFNELEKGVADEFGFPEKDTPRRRRVSGLP